MSGSINDSDFFESDRDDTWSPPQASSKDDQYEFSWKEPWEKIEIQICLPNGELLKHFDGTRYVAPLKVQFLKMYHLELLQQIIRGTQNIQFQSITIKDQLFEITIKSQSFVDECMEIITELTKTCEEVIMRPTQRLKCTSKLAESVFRNHLIQRKLYLFRDESTIFVVAYQNMKDCIDKGIAEINRKTTMKTIIMNEKWEMIALTKFGIIEDPMLKKDDVSFILDEQSDKVCIKGSNEDVKKSADQLQQMLKCVSVEYISFDPLVLKLLLFREASQYFNDNLRRRKTDVEWIVEDGTLCVFGKHKVNSHAIKCVLYSNFVSVGFNDVSADAKSFCRSQDFSDITTKYVNKLLVFEDSREGINLAATKDIVCILFSLESRYHAETTSTVAIQVNTMDKMLDQLTNEKNQLETKLRKETKIRTDDIKREVKERERLENQVKELQCKLGTAESNLNEVFREVTSSKEFKQGVEGKGRRSRRFGDNDMGTNEKPMKLDLPMSMARSSFSAVDKKSFKTINGLVVKVYVENILKLNVDCIANASNENLSHGGGLADVISRAAGYGFQQESDDYIQKHGPLAVTECCTTSAGDLKYKCVIHAIGPRWFDYPVDKRHCARDLQTTIINCLKEAENNSVTSVALPSISAGIFGVPRDVCCSEYCKAVLEYSSKHGKTTSLKEIHFIDKDYDMVTKIQTEFAQCLNLFQTK